MAPRAMRPLSLFALGVVAGSALYPWLQPSRDAAIVATALLLLLAVRSALALPAAGLCLGLAMVAAVPTGPCLRGSWRVRGVVAGAATGGEFDLTLTSAGPLGGEERPASGRVRIRSKETPPGPGTRLAAIGEAAPIDLTRLPGEADPAVDAARAGVRSVLVAREIRATGPPARPVRVDGAEHAGLIAALVRGDRATLPDEEEALLRRTGTWHLVSVSGLHIGLVAATAAGIVWVLMRPLALVWPPARSRWIPAAAAIAASIAYGGWARWPIPARRSVAMVTAVGLSRASARLPDAWDVLAFGAIAAVYAEPGAAGNVSFQLSFGALIGAALWTPRVTRFVPPDTSRIVSGLVAAIAGSTGATIGTLPIIAWRFGTVAPWAAFANLWAIPWIGTIATPAALVGQLLPGPPGTFALAVADSAIDVGLGGLQLLDGAPLAVVVAPWGALVLGLAALLAKRAKVAGVLAMLAVWPTSARPDALTLDFLAVGQGDATLVRWPDGRRWLVDGGPPSGDLPRVLRRLGVWRLDEVILSHAHPDHFGGLIPVVAAMEVGGLRANHVPVELAGVPRVAGAEPGLEVLGPPEGFVPEGENDASLVLRLCYEGHCVLLPGDVESAAEGALAGVDLHADVLKAPHHGSRTSSTQGFVDAVRPEVVVICVGANNRYGHPNLEPLARYRGKRVYRTDRDGTVRVRISAAGVHVERIDPPRPWLLR